MPIPRDMAELKEENASIEEDNEDGGGDGDGAVHQAFHLSLEGDPLPYDFNRVNAFEDLCDYEEDCEQRLKAPEKLCAEQARTESLFSLDLGS